MITCTNCDTPQFLQIFQSRMRFDSGEPEYVFERYECTNCGGEGTQRIEDGEPEVTGDVHEEPTRPITTLEISSGNEGGKR